LYASGSGSGVTVGRRRAPAVAPPTAVATETKGGRKGGKCSSYADVNSSYMISDTKGGRKGGQGFDFLNNSLNVKNLLLILLWQNLY
jgi:hypothetical protein